MEHFLAPIDSVWKNDAADSSGKTFNLAEAEAWPLRWSLKRGEKSGLWMSVVEAWCFQASPL